MAAITEAQRVQIRKYVGFASLFTQRDPRLESAITSIQSVTDGGSQPTSDSQIEMLAIVTSLNAYDVQIENLMTVWGASEVGRGAVKLDTAREMIRLNMRGRVLCARLARMLDTYPRADAFSPSKDLATAYPQWPRSSY